MKPRITDWARAGGVGIAFATGLWTLLTGRAEQWWVFALHGVAGYGVALLLVPKLWRVRGRLAPGLLIKRAWAGLASTLLVLAVIATGVAWAGGAHVVALGYNALNWHILAGIVLTAIVSLHMLLRARPLRR
ncbi:MAG: molybdopterin-binding oxidoreductase, partial [Chloroflexales bacterium]|nr:molybdopterin-binding oxidoreductase [Chloroflexales bacterium]